MKRKLVQMGKHTLMAAIPSKWIKRHKLKKGDSIEFNEVENKLVATSTAEMYERKTEVTITSPTIMITWRTLQPTYTSGYDEVKVNFKDRKALQLIESHMKHLIGFDIVETGHDYVILKTISKQLDKEFDTILRKAFLILKNIADVALECFETKNREKFEEVKLLEYSINKYIMFLKRLINRTGYKYPHYMYMLISFMELAANHIEYIRRNFKRSNIKRIESETIKEFKKLHKYVNRVYDLYYNYSDEKFRLLEESLPHFHWFKGIKEYYIRSDFTMMAEYLVQMSRQIKALNT